MEGELTREGDRPAAELGDLGEVLSPGETLFVPNRKRLSCSYRINEAGVRELRLDYGRKEIFFDEPHLFAFGEQLVAEPTFTGARATAWGPGYTWDELRPLLEVLLDEGILARGDETREPRPGGIVESRLPPSVCPAPRYWTTDNCEAITTALSGHAVEIGYLETFLPIHRVAHAALDGDDRQVGEANVNPWLLRLDRDTEWRVCQYPGSRYRDELPMNVTALKAMIKHWKPMMATLLAVRGYVARRLAIAHPVWTIGELHVLSCAVLALPAYPLMKGGGATPQPPVHPVLSSLFRIVDGIRMVTADMVTGIERPRRPELPLTGAQLYERAEEDGMFITAHGVCAGPKHMMDELLAIAVDGQPAPGVTGDELPAEVRALLDELPAAMDYGFYGMQVWALSYAIWLPMTETYEALTALLDPTGDDALAPRLRADAGAIRWKQLVDARQRNIHLPLYVDTWEHARQGARVAIGDADFARATAPVAATEQHARAADRLRPLLAAKLPAVAVARATELLVDYVRAEQAVLIAMAPLVEAINALLDRPRPSRALTVRDFHVHHTLGGGPHKFPYLFDSLDEALGIRVTASAGAIAIT
jgi:hypothetical protein